MRFVWMVVAVVVGLASWMDSSARAQQKPDVLQTTLTMLGACQVQAELNRQNALTWEKVKAEIEAANPKSTFEIDTKQLKHKP